MSKGERRVIWETRIPSVDLAPNEADEFGYDYGDVFVRFVRRDGVERGIVESSLPVPEGGEQPKAPGDYDEVSMLDDSESKALGMLLDHHQALVDACRAGRSSLLAIYTMLSRGEMPGPSLLHNDARLSLDEMDAALAAARGEEQP